MTDQLNPFTTIGVMPCCGAPLVNPPQHRATCSHWKPRFNRELNYRCRHFNGIQNKHCKAGVNYDSLPAKALHPDHPCHKMEKTICDRYDGYTVEELEQQRADLEARLQAFREDISPCCKAPIDKTHVITSGRNKNHGPRFCSKCGKLLFMV